MLLLAVILLARSDEPAAYQCQAVWVGPLPECGLVGNWSGDGAGRSEKAAQKAALESLTDTVSIAANVAAKRTAGTMAAATTAPQVDTCPRSADERATVTCIPADNLADYQMCFVDLPDRVCGYNDHFTLETYGYKAFEAGRKRMCDQMKAEVRETQKDDAKVDECVASCNQRVRVRCPGIPAKAP